MDNIIVWPLSVENEAIFDMQFHLIVVSIFELCLWRHSLCSNLGGIDPEKLYRATLRQALEKLEEQTV